MKNKMINDWNPETRSLLKALMKAGFVLDSCDNGEDEYTHKPGAPLGKLIEELTACDEARLYITHPDSPKGSFHWIYLVLGNSPGELVSDYGIPNNEQVAAKLEAVTASHYEMWEGKAQPKKPSPY